MKRAVIGALLIGLVGCPSEPPGPTGGSAGSGGTTGSTGGTPVWSTIFSGKELGGAVLSAWGSGPNDVYVVGGPLGNSGFEAVVVHWGGAKWERLTPGGAASFWWVAGTGPKDVWMVGEKGRITHWDGATFQEHTPLTTATLWGVWAASPTDAWAVGGTPGGGLGAPNDVVLHWDGTSWKEEALPMKLGRSLNKVWGASADDIYAVGEAATVWHRKGTTWSQESTPAQSNLLTIHGCSANDVYAVGGQDVIHSDGASWSKVEIALTNVVNGVSCGSGGDVVIVGAGGLKQRLVSGAWVDDFKSEPYGDLHGAWVDAEGTAWTAGGDFASLPTAGVARKAVIGRFGAGVVPVLTP